MAIEFSGAEGSFEILSNGEVYYLGDSGNSSSVLDGWQAMVFLPIPYLANRYIQGGPRAISDDAIMVLGTQGLVSTTMFGGGWLVSYPGRQIAMGVDDGLRAFAADEIRQTTGIVSRNLAHPETGVIINNVPYLDTDSGRSLNNMMDIFQEGTGFSMVMDSSSGRIVAVPTSGSLSVRGVTFNAMPRSQTHRIIAREMTGGYYLYGQGRLAGFAAVKQSGNIYQPFFVSGQLNLFLNPTRAFQYAIQGQIRSAAARTASPEIQAIIKLQLQRNGLTLFPD